jgi:hypothetical protein
MMQLDLKMRKTVADLIEPAIDWLHREKEENVKYHKNVKVLSERVEFLEKLILKEG